MANPLKCNVLLSSWKINSILLCNVEYPVILQCTCVQRSVTEVDFYVLILIKVLYLRQYYRSYYNLKIDHPIARTYCD